MKESDLESILAKYPDLIEDGLILLGRQVTTYGRRMDLLFEDRFKRKLIVELKAGPIKDEHIGQIFSYEGMILSADNPDIRVMLIGTRVPPNIQRSLDHHGIAWKEIRPSYLKDLLIQRGDDQFINLLEDEFDPFNKKRISTHNPTIKGEYNMASSGSMPKKGDMFVGEISDLSLGKDAEGWKKREIIFFKREIQSKEKYDYPTPGASIILIDVLGNRYKLNFSNPDNNNRICLGTPLQLKPWYKREGFSDIDVKTIKKDGYRDKIYFEYTGQDFDFLILSESEFRLKQIKM